MGARSGPILEGVLVKEWMLPEVGHELIDRGWSGAGESIDATDMASRSGVAGSRYGFVVLMKVTVVSVRRRMKPFNGVGHPPFLGMSSQIASFSNVFL